MITELLNFLNIRKSPLLQDEQLVVDIITKMISDPETILMVAPVSGKYYMEHKRLKYVVVISSETIKLTNLEWNFTFRIPYNEIAKLVNLVTIRIEEDRLVMETKMDMNEIAILTKISGSLNL